MVRIRVRKQKEKELALILRRKGYSYSEIRKKIKVSKSTLNYWFKQEGLVYEPSHLEIQRLKRIEKFVNQNVGALARKAKLEKQKEEFTSWVIKKIRKFGSERDLFIIGCVLYWTEGRKEGLLQFSNSDPLMHRLFLKFLRKCLGIKEFKLSLYLHENQQKIKDNLLKFWSRELAVAKNSIKIYYKRHVPKRKIYKKEYRGLLNLVVPKSSLIRRALLEVARKYIAG